ncbi:SDR family NAD(P)-dependent oxidoreductase [Salmonella enterica subsp. enterica serovar Eastbourne]|nr:SDR family NAD(P)-dependent oxidoreductase [Salmonella enterica subsp. enterica serovar Eastbourne]EHC5910051.1 SDR family NAD(P)-dependent oxidoreductase [Salmonella enterica subsp. enterica serovar Eastbourne]
MSNVFISGVSDGIGFALAKLYLDRGWTVYGISRRCPELLRTHKRFVFQPIDLAKFSDEGYSLKEEFSSLVVGGIEIAYLNAGTSGGVPLSAKETSLQEVQRIIHINALSNKVLLDILLAIDKRPKVIVASASIAGVRFRAGMLSYSMSKAALIALCGVYAKEYPDVFFAVLGLCNVDTHLSREIVQGQRVPLFPDHVALRERFREPGYVAQPEERARQLFEIACQPHLKGLQSGQYLDIRDLLSSTTLDGD